MKRQHKPRKTDRRKYKNVEYPQISLTDIKYTASKVGN